MLAPIAVFGFNRPNHLLRTLTSLSENIGARESDIYVFLDGPRKAEDQPECTAVQKVAESFRDAFGSFELRKRESNAGLARSIIEGVSSVLDNHPTVIVVEDDLVTSPYFLKFMNQGLADLINQKQVASIHGYLTPFKKPVHRSFFLRGADCWGWATWKDRWQDMNTDGQALLTELERGDLTDLFDLDGAYPFTQMLRDQIEGKNNSWAIRWHASSFLLNRLTLYPRESLVNNIGFDGSGTHTGFTKIYGDKLANYCPEIPNGPFSEDAEAREQLKFWYTNIYFSKKSKFKGLARKLYEFFCSVPRRLFP